MKVFVYVTAQESSPAADPKARVPGTLKGWEHRQGVLSVLVCTDCISI